MTSSKTISNNDYYDAVLVGAGIMSSTLLLLLSEVLPDIKILIKPEQLRLFQESFLLTFFQYPF